MLNEHDSQTHKDISPTDSRLRPDMRAMEEGNTGDTPAISCLIITIYVTPFNRSLYYVHVAGKCLYSRRGALFVSLKNLLVPVYFKHVCLVYLT